MIVGLLVITTAFSFLFAVSSIANARAARADAEYLSILKGHRDSVVRRQRNKAIILEAERIVNEHLSNV